MTKTKINFLHKRKNGYSEHYDKKTKKNENRKEDRKEDRKENRKEKKDNQVNQEDKKENQYQIQAGGAAGTAPTVLNDVRIIIDSNSYFDDIYKLFTVANWNQYIDIIYSREKSKLITERFEKIKTDDDDDNEYEFVNENKIITDKKNSISNEISKYNGNNPFLIYIDDNNELSKTTPKKNEKYIITYGTYTTDAQNKLNLGLIENAYDTTNINPIIPNINDVNFVFIKLPKDNPNNRINFEYENHLNNILNQYKQKNLKNNQKLLIIYDFDCTLTSNHVFKSLYEKKFPITEGGQIINYPQLEKEFNDFDEIDHMDPLRQKIIDRYFGSTAAMQKQTQMFERIKNLLSATIPITPLVTPLVTPPITPPLLTSTQVTNFTSDPTYFQQQDSPGCGHNALNNLLGGSFFIKGDFNSDTPYTKAEILQNGNKLSTSSTFNLIKFCKYIASQTASGLAGNFNILCQVDENYDENILELALQVCGFKTENKSATGAFKEESDATKTKLLGYIINYGGSNWVALKYSPEKTQISPPGSITVQTIVKNYKLIDSSSYRKLGSKYIPNDASYKNIDDYIADMTSKHITPYKIIMVEQKDKQIDSLNDNTILTNLEQKNTDLLKRKKEFNDTIKPNLNKNGGKFIKLLEFYYCHLVDLDLNDLKTILGDPNILKKLEDDLIGIENNSEDRKLEYTIYYNFLFYYHYLIKGYKDIELDFNAINIYAKPILNSSEDRQILFPNDKSIFKKLFGIVDEKKQFDIHDKYKLFDEVLTILLNIQNTSPVNTVKNSLSLYYIHPDLKNTDPDLIKIKQYKYNGTTLENIFKYNATISTIIENQKRYDEYEKEVNYLFASSNKEIFTIYDELKNTLKYRNLNKMYKVFPESKSDVFDHNKKENAIGTLNPMIVEIIDESQNQEIKVLTYNIKYNLEKDDSNSLKYVKDTLCENMDNNVDFICLQEFNYVNTKQIYDNDGASDKIIKSGTKKDLLTYDDKPVSHPFDKINSNIESINKKDITDTMKTKYKFVFNLKDPEMQFTFYNSDKYEIVRDNNKDLIIYGQTSNNSRPYTLIVLKKKYLQNSDEESIILINVHFPQKNNKNDNGIFNITPNDYINEQIVSHIQKSEFSDKIGEYIKKSRIIVAGDFNRTIFSNDKDQSNYFSNESIKGTKRGGDRTKNELFEIDNSAYGLKLFKGLFTVGDNKPAILYNIPTDKKTFNNSTCKHSNDKGHIDNVLDSFGLQYKYEYFNDDYKGSDHKAVLVTLLGAKPIYDLTNIPTQIFKNSFDYKTKVNTTKVKNTKKFDYPQFCYE